MRQRSPVSILAPIAGATLLHLTGITVVGAGLLFFTLSPSASAQLFSIMQGTESLRADLWFGAGVHFALSSVVWLLLYAVFGLARERTRSVKVRKLAAVPRGTVMVETVIVLPVFLLLVFGLMQMTINNIASVMTSYAGFAGARAVWVWDGERVANRRGVDDEAVLERARIQVALAMAPIATGDFLNTGSLSDEFKMARKAMHGRFSYIGGDAAILLAATDVESNTQAYRSNKSFWRALDSESFGHRAVRKFTRAYLATDVGQGSGGASASSDDPGIMEVNGEIGLRFTYQHHQTMPVVSNIFGEFGTSGGRGGYFNELSKEHTLPRQRHTPSATWPEQ